MEETYTIFLLPEQLPGDDDAPEPRTQADWSISENMDTHTEALRRNTSLDRPPPVPTLRGHRAQMTSIGGWWLSTFELRADESLLEYYAVNYFHGERRPYGGRLYLSDLRLIFVPHRIDALFGVRTATIELVTIADVRRDADGPPTDNGDHNPPACLTVQTDDGDAHYFVMNDIDLAVERILDAIRTAASRDSDP